jgi:hypothetical protein
LNASIRYTARSCAAFKESEAITEELEDRSDMAGFLQGAEEVEGATARNVERTDARTEKVLCRSECNPCVGRAAATVRFPALSFGKRQARLSGNAAKKATKKIQISDGCGRGERKDRRRVVTATAIPVVVMVIFKRELAKGVLP